MSEKAIWLTVEEPVTQEEMENITRIFESTELSDRYELIVSGDSINTVDIGEIRELLKEDANDD